MGIPEHEKLTVDEFFDAISGSEGRYELVGGIAYAMAGAKEGHNVICSNVQTAFCPGRKAEGVSHYIERHGRPDRARYGSVSGRRGGLRSAQCGSNDCLQTYDYR